MKPEPCVYNATVTAVHDGNTVTVDIDQGLDTLRRGVKIRLNGIIAEEPSVIGIFGENPGLAAQIWLSSRINGKAVVLRIIKDRQDAGHILGEIWCDDVCINTEIVNAGHAVAWNGQGVRPVPTTNSTEADSKLTP